MKQHYRLHTLAQSFLALGIFASGIAVAADDDAERIIVTGSHIKRIDQENSSPVLIIDRESIKLSGARTLSELLQMSPYTGSGSFNEAITTGFTPGAAAFDLRGFGPERTLTLVNGRRRAIYPFGANGSTAFVDFNSIPLASIRRIEILKDGASALYGSDAVAGVVNIITEDGYEGVEVNLTGNATQAGGAEEGAANFKWGTAIGNTEWFIALDASVRNELLGEDRDFADSLKGPFFDGRNSVSGEGYIVDFNNNTVTPGPGCAPENIVDVTLQSGPTGQRCLYDYAGESQLLPDAERYAGEIAFKYHFDQISLSLRLSHANLETTSTGYFTAAVPTFVQWESNDTVAVVRRLTEVGAPTIITESKTNTAVIALNGTFGEFEWDASVYTVRNKVDENYAEGWMLVSQRAALQNMINNGEYDLRTHLDQSIIDSQTQSFWHLGESNIDAVDARVSGPVMDTVMGPIWMAAGIEHRKEEFFDRSHEAIITGQVVGLGASGAEGERDASAAYVEFAIPAGDLVEFSVAGRHDNYGDYGSTNNPKVGISFRPSDAFLLRYSWGKGFRAPGLHQLFTNENRGSFGAALPFVQTGNPDLDPEKSESSVLGFLIAPSPAFELQLDFWQTEIDNIITDFFSGGGSAYFNENCLATFADPNADEVQDSLCDRIVLRPAENGTENPVDVGVNTLFNPFYNLAGMRGQGADLALRFTFDNVFGGTLKWQTEVAHIAKLEEKTFPGNPYEEYQGKRATPENRATMSFTWNGENVTHAVVAHYVGEWEFDYQPSANEVTTVEVDAHTPVDYQFGVNVFNAARLILGVKNIADKEPPVSSLAWPYFNRNLYSALGRTFTVGWQMNF